MDPLSSRWAAIDADRRAYAPALHDPTTMTPACGGLRVRREYASRDAINARAWDNFHATPPTQVSSADLKQAGRPVYMDMNPIACRTKNEIYRAQISYMPDPPRASGAASEPGVVTAGPKPPPPTFSANPYLQRLDAGGDDERNIIRELRSAVVEDNRERQIDADKMLAQRQFYDRWLPAKTATDAASLQAYELLRPKTDNWR
jgi:hypothetical protein